MNGGEQDAPGGAVVAGHICLDVILDIGPSAAADLSHALQPGRLLEVGPAVVSTGGPVSNTGLALHLLGIPTRLICKIGRDPFGGVIHDSISARSPELAAGIVEDPSVTTSYSVVLSPPGVDRIFLHHPGANDSFDADDVDFGLVERAALFHFGYPPVMRRMYERGGRGLAELLRRARETGATTSLDMSYPDPSSAGGRVEWRTILESALPLVDVFVPSIEELLSMLHPARLAELSANGPAVDGVTPELLHELGDELLGMGVRVLVIKLGERGLYLRTASRPALLDLGRAAPRDVDRWDDREFWAPCFRVPVLGTTGAGDATIAGFHAALLRGLGPEEAVTTALAVGACNVEAPDAVSGLRSWEETRRRIGSGWERLPFELRDAAWHRVEDSVLWERSRAI